MDDVSNYVASGWKRDLTHIISCYWAAQVGPLDSKEWEVAIQKFLKAMKNRKASEWTDIILKFMPYMAELFRNITSRDLKGLGDFTGWVGHGGYYHWKLLQLGQLSACPHLQGQPVPDGPIAQPSGQPHPCRPAQTGARHAILVFPLTMQTALFCITSCLPFSCRPRRALVWGTIVRGLRVEIFVRVLHSSRVNLHNVNNTNVFCCV